MDGGASGPHWRGGFVITLGGVPWPGGGSCALVWKVTGLLGAGGAGPPSAVARLSGPAARPTPGVTAAPTIAVAAAAAALITMRREIGPGFGELIVFCITGGSSIQSWSRGGQRRCKPAHCTATPAHRPGRSRGYGGCHATADAMPGRKIRNGSATWSALMHRFRVRTRSATKDRIARSRNIPTASESGIDKYLTLFGKA